MTSALLERGVVPERLLAIEYNPDFADHIKTRFPSVGVAVGDAYQMGDTLKRQGVDKVSAVVSSLPLFTKPPMRRRHLIEQAMEALEPVIRSFSSPMPSCRPLPAEPGHWSLDVTRWIVRNLPPARVWIYRKIDPNA